MAAADISEQIMNKIESIVKVHAAVKAMGMSAFGIGAEGRSRPLVEVPKVRLRECGRCGNVSKLAEGLGARATGGWVKIKRSGSLRTWCGSLDYPLYP
jgi:hypothetical protein